ncbi:cobalt transporter CbiM [Consotaella salsifontis]|uniref:Cobalt/nickel transport system permease protein n=1 Tax=Consotaella salsifontis TaxID=1365950 RepID=A0A1T4NYT8_9HYPH|nr:cobalt transporter CbiM [Consotaella salsifontis]SJZ84433.1 cobalt/nickel transport system permease protein [Consotaella salsifontis]
MAHIPDGILSAPVLIGGGALCIGGLALALKGLDERDIPKTAILSAGFFVVSLVAVPIGPTSVHLLLGGLAGLILGLGAFPAIFVGLLLQALFFGMGGLTSLGVNTVNMALPGVLLALAARPLMAQAPTSRCVALAGMVGALSVLGTAALLCLSLWLSSPAYAPTLAIIAATYLPLAAAEGVITALIAGYLGKVKPEALFAGTLPEPAE